jgi:ribose-phosphate pyrophosphokinase
MPEFSLLAGSASRALTSEMARLLEHRVSASRVERFPDGELTVDLGEPVRGFPVFVVQSLAPPVTENLFELLLFVDACRRSAADRITAIVPYLGYARADKRHKRREPIAASLVASLLQVAGLDHLVTVDLHAAQIEGFYHVPVDNLTAVPTLCDELKQRIAPGTVVVSPDEGRVKTAGEFANRLGAPVAVLHKERKTGTETKVMKVIGDVAGRPCLIIDDMIATGGTLANAIAALLEAGARPEMTVAATHGVLIDGAREQLRHETLREIIVTDTIAPHHSDWPELSVVSLAPLLATVIHRLAERETIRDLFE